MVRFVPFYGKGGARQLLSYHICLATDWQGLSFGYDRAVINLTDIYMIFNHHYGVHGDA